MQPNEIVGRGSRKTCLPVLLRATGLHGAESIVGSGVTSSKPSPATHLPGDFAKLCNCLSLCLLTCGMSVGWEMPRVWPPRVHFSDETTEVPDAWESQKHHAGC